MNKPTTLDDLKELDKKKNAEFLKYLADNSHQEGVVSKFNELHQEWNITYREYLYDILDTQYPKK